MENRMATINMVYKLSLKRNRLVTIGKIKARSVSEKILAGFRVRRKEEVC